MNTTRRRFLAGLSVLAVAPALAACGDDTTASDAPAAPSGSSGSSGSGSAGPEEGAYPVTITHKYGETTIEKAPQRVVCVGLTEQDALMALGTVPVAITYWFGDEKYHGVYPWAQDALGDADLPTVLEDTDGIQIEKVAALAPDLILGQYTGMTESEYTKLSAMGVPVVAQSGEYADYGMPWAEMTLNIGKVVGRPQAAQDLVDATKKVVSDAAAANPGFRGQTAAVVTPYEGLFLYGTEDPRSRMMLDLGFELHPLIADSDKAEFGTSVSRERTSELGDVGVAVWYDLGADDQVRKVFKGTPAYEQGRWVDITDADGDFYVAQSFVTPLSIPYNLERFVPMLAAAADGDPATKPPAVTT